MKFIKKVLINKNTGQPSITLSKKAILKLFKRMPSEVEVKIKPVKW